MSIIIPKSKIVDINSFKTGNRSTRQNPIPRKMSDMMGQIVHTVDWAVNGGQKTLGFIHDSIPLKYQNGQYGIQYIRIYSIGEFTAQLVIGGCIIEELNSNSLLPQDKDPVEPDTYRFDLTNNIILINLACKFFLTNVTLKSSDPTAIVRYDIVKHNYTHMPKRSLVYDKQYCNGIIKKHMDRILLNGFCNEIYVWIKDATYVKLKITRDKFVWGIIPLKKHPTESNLWMYEFNDPSNANFNNTINLSRIDTSVIEADVPDGTHYYIRSNGYNIFMYSYQGSGRGKIGVRMTGLYYQS